MSTEQKTVFISYRRDVAKFIARSIFQDLRHHHYDVFMDVESIDSGNFEQIIFNQIEARAHFLVILTPGTIERCAEPKDMIRREIEYAMDKGRNIVPILVNEFSFTGTEQYLTGKLVELNRFNGLTVPHDYFEAAMDRLRARFLKQPTTVEVKPTPDLEQPVVEKKIEEVAAQPAPTQKQLSAEEYFSRAYQKDDTGDFDGAIADLNEAIRLNPQGAEAYNNRGSARRHKGDMNGAIADLSDAISVNPSYALAYYNRGLVQKTINDFHSAIADYTEAIRLNPKYAEAYDNRGIARIAIDDLDGAITDYTEAIRLNTKYSAAFNNRALAWIHKGDLDSALADLNEAIRLNPQLVQAYINRGNVHQNKGDLDSAITDLNEAIRLEPQTVDAYLNRGFVEYKKNNLNASMKDFDQAISINPEFAQAYINRGVLYLIDKKFDKALENYRQANNLQPVHPMTISGLALTQYLLGQKAEAKRLWRTLIAQDQHYRDANWVGKEFNWRSELIEAARQLIAEL